LDLGFVLGWGIIFFIVLVSGEFLTGRFQLIIRLRELANFLEPVLVVEWFFCCLLIFLGLIPVFAVEKF